MSVLTLWSTALRHLLLQTCLCLVLVLDLSSSATDTTPHSCAYTYTLRSDESGGCIRSSFDEYTTCTSLAVYLESFNSGMYSGSDCIQFILEPGLYVLSGETSARMRYSVVMTSTSLRNVFIRCMDSHVPSGRDKLENYFGVLSFVGTETSSVVLDEINFEGCNQPLQFEYLQSVVISNCSFRGYTASAVDISNVINIEITDCYFNDCSTNTEKPKFHGNSGAVSVAYFPQSDATFLSNRTNPFLSISNSIFTNNRAILPPGISQSQLDEALNNNIYHGRGGAVGIYVQENVRNVSVKICDCLFDNNNADSFGGGLYLNINGQNTTHSFVVEDTNFTRNSVNGEGGFGGAVQIALLIQNIGYPPTEIEFIRCHFEGNNGSYGGGLSSIQTFSQGAGNLVSISECTFVNNRAKNVGSALMFASFLYVQNRFESPHYRCHHNLFRRNSAPGGTFGVAFINTNMSGHNRLEFNEGPGLRVVGSQVEILRGGLVSFIGNNAESREGGALFMQDFGQIKLHSNSSMEFINNTGRIGSAIVVTVQRASPVFSQLVYNPQCFLIYENASRSPGEWDDVSIRFSGNRASVGPAVYISHLDHCSWFSVNTAENNTNEINVTFQIEQFPNWKVFEFNETNYATSLKDDPTASTYYFQTEPVNISSSNGTAPLPIRPGERSRVNFMGVDQFGNPAYVILRLSDSRKANTNAAFSQAGDSATNDSMDSNQVRFEPSLLPIQPSDESVTVVYGFPSLSAEEFRQNQVIPILLDTPYTVRSAEKFYFNLSIVPCQPGYELRQQTDGDRLLSCRCVRDNDNILDCEEDVIIMRDGFWGVEEDEPTPHLDLTPCPASYCRCHTRGGQTCEALFFQQDPTLNLQCHPLRNGTLCGQCINGTGVGVLRTNCRDCDQDNYYAIALLVVGDIILVALILVIAIKLHVSFPESMKGLLFYVQTAYYTTEYFPISFWNIRKYMLFLSSAIGLYFPWDFCLFPSMTPLVSFAPKFTPAAIATLGSTIAIITVYVTRSRDGREYVWHGVWSLVLLLYAPLVHTCLNLLQCPYTPSADGEEEAFFWYLDGAVKCFQDPSHTALGVIAIFVLLALVLLVPAVFVFTVIASSKQIQSQSRTIEWMYTALTAGYRDSWEAKWWSSFELLRRLVILGIAVVLPGRSVANLYVLLNVLAIHLFLKPYKKLWLNVLEAVILLNYALLMMIRATPSFLDTHAIYSGIQIPDNWNGDLTTTDGVTWLLFPFFYFPVLLGVVLIVTIVIYHGVRKLKVCSNNWSLRRPPPAGAPPGVMGNDDFVEGKDVYAKSVNYTRSAFGLDEL